MHKNDKTIIIDIQYQTKDYLSPLLFLLILNYVSSKFKHSKFLLFANNVKLFVKCITKMIFYSFKVI